MSQKEKKMKKRILTLVMMLALVAVLVVPMAVFAADNDAGQVASTSMAVTFLIGGTEAGTKDTAVTTITFPAGAPSAVISNPYNNQDTDTDPQVLSATISEPVVKIKNTHGTQAYNVVLEITTWTSIGVNMEYYNLATDGATNIETVTLDLSNASGAAKTVSTGVSIAAGAYGDLYLKLVLGSVGGVTSTSTLTVLGET
jgi:hypothetical protein